MYQFRIGAVRWAFMFLQESFQLLDDFGMLAVEIGGLGKIGFQIVELNWWSVCFKFSIFDAVDVFG